MATARTLIDIIQNDSPEDVLLSIASFKKSGNTAVFREQIDNYGPVNTARKRMVRVENEEQAKWIPVFAALFEAGADPNEKNRHDYPVFIDLCAPAASVEDQYRLQLVQLFMQAGVDPDSKDREQKTALHHLSAQNDVEALAALLEEAQAAINSQDIYGNTPLHRAESEKMVQLLVQNKADLEVVNNKGETPLYFTREVEVICCLLTVGANVHHNENTLTHFYALKGMDVSKCKTLASDINKKNKEGDTPLLLAGRAANTNVFKLLENKADITMVNAKGENILHVIARSMLNAALYGRLDSKFLSAFNKVLLNYDPTIIKILLEARDVDGNTPLQIVTTPEGLPLRISLQLIQWLAPLYQKTQAKIEIPDQEERTPLRKVLDYAYGDLESKAVISKDVIRALLELGVNIHDKANERYDYVEYANKVCRAPQMAAFLEEAHQQLLARGPTTLLMGTRQFGEGSALHNQLVASSGRSLYPLKLVFEFLKEDKSKDKKEPTIKPPQKRRS